MKCPEGTYAEDEGTTTCTKCATPEGDTSSFMTWTKESTKQTECRCKMGFYAPNAYTVPLTFESVGCMTPILVPLPTGGSEYLMPKVGEVVVDTTHYKCNWQCMLHNSKLSQHKQHVYFALSGTTCYCQQDMPEGDMNPTTSCATSCSGDPTEACGGTETQLSWFKMINVRNIGTPCTPCEVVNTATGFKKAAHCKGSFYPPYTRKGFWASEKLPFLFFKCEKGICQGGSAGYLQDGADLDPFGRSIVLGKCGPFAKGVMCAGCLPGSFKKGKQCMACPPSDWGFVLYTIAPVIMVLGWMPFIYWFVGGGIGPSLFISYAYFQISAAVGGFACEWPDTIRFVLGNLGTPSCQWQISLSNLPF